LGYDKAKYLRPMKFFMTLPKPKAKPNKNQIIPPTQGMSAFFTSEFMWFFYLTEPASSIAKPACIINMTTPPNNNQIRLIDTSTPPVIRCLASSTGF
jgi:hypothetical protein